MPIKDQDTTIIWNMKLTVNDLTFSGTAVMVRAGRGSQSFYLTLAPSSAGYRFLAEVFPQQGEGYAFRMLPQRAEDYVDPSLEKILRQSSIFRGFGEINGAKATFSPQSGDVRMKADLAFVESFTENDLGQVTVNWSIPEEGNQIQSR
jgi:hypothetical protein